MVSWFMPWRFGSRRSVFVHCSYAHWSSHVAFGVASISDGFDAVAIFVRLDESFPMRYIYFLPKVKWYATSANATSACMEI